MKLMKEIFLWFFTGQTSQVITPQQKAPTNGNSHPIDDPDEIDFDINRGANVSLKCEQLPTRSTPGTQSP